MHIENGPIFATLYTQLYLRFRPLCCFANTVN